MILITFFAQTLLLPSVLLAKSCSSHYHGFNGEDGKSGLQVTLHSDHFEPEDYEIDRVFVDSMDQSKASEKLRHIKRHPGMGEGPAFGEGRRPGMRGHRRGRWDRNRCQCPCNPEYGGEEPNQQGPGYPTRPNFGYNHGPNRPPRPDYESGQPDSGSDRPNRPDYEAGRPDSDFDSGSGGPGRPDSRPSPNDSFEGSGPEYSGSGPDPVSDERRRRRG